MFRIKAMHIILLLYKTVKTKQDILQGLSPETDLLIWVHFNPNKDK